MFEARNGFVKAGARVDGAWDISTVADGYYYGPLDIAVGPDGVAKVTWHDHQAGSFQAHLGDIELGIRTADGWDHLTLGDGGHDGWDTRMIIDDEGVLHAAGIDPMEFDGDGVEYYRLDTNGDVTVEQVGSGPLSYKFAVSVDTDSAGTAYVTYHDQDSNDLILAERGDAGWSLETVDAEGSAGQFAELAIDNSDRIHISYVTQTGNNTAVVKYATRGAGESDWTITDVDTLDNIFYGFEGAREITSISIDSAGNPWIAYSDESTLKLAVGDGSGFRTDTITTSEARGPDFGQLVSLQQIRGMRRHRFVAWVARCQTGCSPIPISPRSTTCSRPGKEEGTSLSIFRWSCRQRRCSTSVAGQEHCFTGHGTSATGGDLAELSPANRARRAG
jgi:hypothetical protein